MDDIAAKISELLKDPNTMQQLSALGGMFSQNSEKSSDDNNSSSQGNVPDSNTINSILGALGQSNSSASEPSQNDGNAEMAGMLMQIAPLLSSIKQDDKNSNLLNALRPFLSDERRKKLDESSKMLQMMKLLPLLKNTGILENFFK